MRKSNSYFYFHFKGYWMTPVKKQIGEKDLKKKKIPNLSGVSFISHSSRIKADLQKIMFF